MKQTIITFFLIIITLTSFSQTQMEMNQELNENYLKTDKELKGVYIQILSEYKTDTNFIEKLKASQLLWVKFRDTELEMKFPEPDKSYYGSIFPMCVSEYLTELTKQRTKKLNEWLKPNIEGDVCGGSLKYRELKKDEISIEKIGNFKIQSLLNGIKILEEFKTSELSVRIMALGNLPGDAGFANGEITHDLFFAVSEFNEYPKQNLFRVERFYNPKIESINSANNLKPDIEISFGQLGKRERIKFELTIDELIRTRR